METATPASPEIAAQLDAARAALAELGAVPSALDSGSEAAQAVAVLTQDADLAAGTLLHWAQRSGLRATTPGSKRVSERTARAWPASSNGSGSCICQTAGPPASA